MCGREGRIASNATGGRKGRDGEGEGGGGLRVARGCGEAAAAATAERRSGLGEGERVVEGGSEEPGSGNRSGFGRDGLPLSGGARTREG